MSSVQKGWFFVRQRLSARKGSSVRQIFSRDEGRIHVCVHVHVEDRQSIGLRINKTSNPSISRLALHPKHEVLTLKSLTPNSQYPALILDARS